MWPEPKSEGYKLDVVAETGSEFVSFEPYVASINDHGAVAFQADLDIEGSGVFVWKDGHLTVISEPTSSLALEATSHPDINNRGEVCFYGMSQTDEDELFLWNGTELEQLFQMGNEYFEIGPLGPTINDNRFIACRATDSKNAQGIWGLAPNFRGCLSSTASKRIETYEGLPVVNQHDSIVFRATFPWVGQAIYAWGDSTAFLPEVLVETGPMFKELGRFPDLNDQFEIAFTATFVDGPSGIFVFRAGEIETLLLSGDEFESFRGILINNSGPAAFYATPVGGQLGIYYGPDPARNCVLQVGQELFGSQVSEFALEKLVLDESPKCC